MLVMPLRWRRWSLMRAATTPVPTPVPWMMPRTLWKGSYGHDRVGTMQSEAMMVGAPLACGGERRS